MSDTDGRASRQQTLYRKWRSQTFNELVGQEAIIQTLRNAIVSGRIGHAYLFTGPRGTGKTSTGRLLAKAVTCLDPDLTARPCDKCEACRSIAEGRAMDLIEIDAASNRGIDEVRELRDKINFQPSFLRKKVYIIDEVHMMTEAAFNALLKTLEEPPPHAMFILATTDPQDIPPTVVSRCQVFNFQRIGLEQITDRLQFICGEEHIPAQTSALEMIARQATGSLRDALSLLDQLIVFSGGNITLEAVRQMLGVMNSEAVTNFVEVLLGGDISAGLEQINRLVQSGTDLKRFNRELVEHLRFLMLLKVNPGVQDMEQLSTEIVAALQSQAKSTTLATVLHCLKIFSAVDYNLKVSPYAQLPLEIALLDALLVSEGSAEATLVAPAPRLVNHLAAPAPKVTMPVTSAKPPEPAMPANFASSDSASAPVAKPVEPKPLEKKPDLKLVPPLEFADEPPTEPAFSLPVVSPTPEIQPVTGVKQDNSAALETAPAILLDLAAIKKIWQQVLKNVDAQSKMSGAVLRDGKPVAVKGNRLTIAFQYSFHASHINKEPHRRNVEDQISKLMGQVVIIECVEEEMLKNAPKPEINEQDRKAAQIFNARIIT